jgi:endonuclease YncB( thermonuclease family)
LELKRLIQGQVVKIEAAAEKTYNREVCIIKENDTNINLEMAKRDAAWAYKNYLRGPYAEREASARRLGLWKDSNPIPPWEFRRLRNAGTAE